MFMIITLSLFAPLFFSFFVVVLFVFVSFVSCARAAFDRGPWARGAGSFLNFYDEWFRFCHVGAGLG